MLQVKHDQSQEIMTDIFIQTAQEQNFRKYRKFRIPFVISLSQLRKLLLLRPKKWGNFSGKSKWIHFSKQFLKRNQKLCVSKLQLEASQAIISGAGVLLCSLVVFCTFKESINFIIFLLDFNDIYVFVLISYLSMVDLVQSIHTYCCCKAKET